jgi:hypothetical protein
MRIQKALIVIALAAGVAHADDRTVLDVEIDPFPFATLRYGVQVGVRAPALAGVRLSVASFSVDVPDLLAESLYGEGTHLDVRPGSGAIYALYYFRKAGEDGFCVGASMRYLRIRSTHDDAPGEVVRLFELSPEAIVGYQWHPFRNGFYVQPWLALGVTIYTRGTTAYGDPQNAPVVFDEPPVSPFFTVNIGYEHSL